MRRRPALIALAGAALATARTAAAAPADAAATSASAGAPTAPPRVAARLLRFPADFGSHPEFRTEWWYVTGALQAPGDELPYGFQATFFRSRTGVDAAQPSPAQSSRFAARQLVFAHAALTDPHAERLRHDQRIARAGFGIAGAAEGDTDVRLRGWSMRREASTAAPAGYAYRVRLDAARQGFAFDFTLAATQPVLAQGDDGVSRKAPDPARASYYLSEPQLAVAGTLAVDGRRLAVGGRAWLDHEWSEAYLDPAAAGWDWIGFNLDDGAALMAFRIRGRDGSPLWAGGSFRPAVGAARPFDAAAVRFTPLRMWQSPATQARYPVAWRVDTPAGTYEVRARLDAQELDGNASTGAVYWEGLSDLFDAAGRRVGRGYLEMTGYTAPLRLG